MVLTKKILLVVSLLITNICFAKEFSEDERLFAGKIEFTKNLNYEQAIESAKNLTKIDGLQSLMVRKMGPDRYGVQLILSFDGTKESKHKILQEFRKLLGQSIQSWDMSSGVTWIKKP